MKTIKKSMVFNTSSLELYDYLTNGKKFAKITGQKATNDCKIGGKFSAYDDYIHGTNEELVPGKKIVQKWTCADFPEGHMTDVKIELKKNGEKQTELDFTQENIPDDFFEDIQIAWDEFYWEPIKDYIEDLMWK
jgi:activator of HSP90 ATPase